MINRREFCELLGAAALALKTGSSAAEPTHTRPNVVYILADDLGWGDMGAYNAHSGIATPNCDAFAKQGMRFTDMHSSSAVCTPSRYSILTGRYCWRSRLKKGVLNGDSPMLIEDGRLTVPALLKQAGYFTAGVGKWHLGLGNDAKTDFSKPLHPGPIDRGFDYYFGIPASLDMAPYTFFENDHVVEAPTLDDAGSKSPRGVYWRAGKRAPHFELPQALPTLTQKAVNVLEEHGRDPKRPFFLYFALPSPHTPWLPLPEYQGKSHAGTYGDYVVEVDAMIGKVLAKLDELGRANDTLVIVTSDNGADWKPEDIEHYGHRANATWRGEKADVWEAGHRIPFLVRWPGKVKPTSVSAETGSLTDLMATIAAIVRVDLPQDAAEDSYDLLPAFEGSSHKPIRASIIDHSIDGMFTIREGNWKLELGIGSGGFSAPRKLDPVADGIQGQLYDLETDPREEINLYATRPDIVERLTNLLQQQQRDGRTRRR